MSFSRRGFLQLFGLAGLVGPALLKGNPRPLAPVPAAIPAPTPKPPPVTYSRWFNHSIEQPHDEIVDMNGFHAAWILRSAILSVERIDTIQKLQALAWS